MIKKRRPNRISMWVDPEFHKQMKVESSSKGMSIINYTRELSETKKVNKEKKKVFNYGF